ncbi:hypothetical protein WKI68_37555 [Streptomyces sp. MS1.HAVA.3]|uniref:Uncharacterized protein n=1 Tax=Streptomyces caledonius TaxID=3134107 RepID=A0ABU8UDL7_9ACTN
MEAPGAQWEAISGPATAVYASRLGVFMINPETGLIYKYQDKAKRWDPIGGGTGKFAVSGGSLYRLTADGIVEWRGDSWTKIGGPAKDFYAGGAGLFATDPVTGVIRKYGGKPDRWTDVGGPGATFAVSSNHLYGLSRPLRRLPMERQGRQPVRLDQDRRRGQGLLRRGRRTLRHRPRNRRHPQVRRQAGPLDRRRRTRRHLRRQQQPPLRPLPDRSAVYQWNGKEGSGSGWAPAGAGLPGVAGRPNQSPYWDKRIKCSQKDADGRVIPTRYGNHLFGWKHLSGPHNIKKCELINAALRDKPDKVDGNRLEYLGHAINGTRQVKIKVIVQYAQKTTEENNPYDAGPGQRIGVVTAFCMNVPNNKCPHWVNQ